MKITMTTIALLATASMASAELKATTEYAVGAEAFALGLDYSTSFNDFDLSVGGDWGLITSEAIDFTGTEIGLGYGVTDSVRVYGKVNLDGSFEYSETTLGVAYTF